MAKGVFMVRDAEFNMHGDHVASCLCCEHFEGRYDEDWSDVTPGDGMVVQCDQGYFGERSGSTPDAIIDAMHDIFYRAPTCADFMGWPE
jgi:hypothetical protein